MSTTPATHHQSDANRHLPSDVLADVPSQKETGNYGVAPNQTQFAEESAINDPGLAGPHSASVRTQRLFMIGAAVVVGLMLIVTLVVLQMREENKTATVTPTPTPVLLDDSPKTELEKRLYFLQQDVAQADPIQSELAFPPVSFKLELEDASVIQQRAEELRRQRQR